MQLPGVVCMLKCDYEPRMPSIKGTMKANRTPIAEYGMEDLGIDQEHVGIKGSPTFVSKAFRPEQKQSGEIISAADAKEAAKALLENLKR